MRDTLEKRARDGEMARLKRQITEVRRDAKAKISALQALIKSQREELQQKTKEIQRLREELQRKTGSLEWTKMPVSELPKEKRWQLKGGGPEEKEAELIRLREEIKYKDQKLASKELEMECYRRVTEERIFQLEAKVKELEARAAAPLVRRRKSEPNH